MHNRKIRRVAVVGAGISGIVTTAHLLRAGFEVTVFERHKKPGGIWLHSNEVAVEPQFPCEFPPDTERLAGDRRSGKERQYLLHAPPGPCYDSLTNNIVTPLMKTTLHDWPENTPRYVNHSVIKNYIQETSAKVGVDDVTIFGALVTNAWKEGSRWCVNWTLLQEDVQNGDLIGTHNTSTFDALVVASGHYHSPRIPDIPGLAEAKLREPERIIHSKWFRNAARLRDKTVLLIGGGVSSTDIAKDVGRTAKAIYQSTRNGLHDMPAGALPENGVRVSEVTGIDIPAQGKNRSSPNHNPFTVHLKCGRVLHDIDYIIICTGYLFTLPFLPQYNNYNMAPSAASGEVLITDGGQVHNLHRDIFYIPDPSLAFVGIPIFNTIFSLFEFQAIAVATVFSGIVQLPPAEAMAEEYRDRVRRRGYGRLLHALTGDEEAYVSRLINWVNDGRIRCGMPPVEGHTAAWKHEMELIQQERLKLRAAKAAEKLAVSEKLTVTEKVEATG
ncbi:Flavin-containing monooxygenase FMO GS-OX-like 4 [Madurella fahalii]|uniref:Flavin-containing monooxygenase FMO GS-OX-like 4 n=1 Tax=Madurella fahalii TaxID=1157608 RepID=A0ABQ0GIR5_9PEZI